MKIRIKENRWNHLKPVSGQLLDVETEFLFHNQFNTAPIPGISETGFRVMMEDIAEIIDDARIGRMLCRWDNTHSPIGPSCPNCGKSEYLEPFQSRFLPQPGQVFPKFKRLIPGSRKWNYGRPQYVINGGIGCAGDSYDNLSHIVGIAGGFDRGNGFQEYTSFNLFMNSLVVPWSGKEFARKAAEEYAKICGF